jgi:hypothetical protein
LIESVPLALKEPGSEPWIIQITHKAQGIWHSLESDTKEWREVVQEIDAERVWEKYPPEKPHGTRDAFYRTELGAPESLLTQLKEAQQLLAHGGDRKSARRNSTYGGTGSAAKALTMSGLFSMATKPPTFAPD